MTILKLEKSKLSKKILSKINKVINDGMKENGLDGLVLDVTSARIDVRKGKIKASVSSSVEMPIKQAFKVIKGS